MTTSDLLQEILALGGTKEDLDFLKDVDEDGKSSKKVSGEEPDEKELMSFMKGELKIKPGKFPVPEDLKEEQEDDEVEELVDDEEEQVSEVDEEAVQDDEEAEDEEEEEMNEMEKNVIDQVKEKLKDEQVKSKGPLLVDSGMPWYEIELNSSSGKKLTEKQVKDLFERARKLHEEEEATYQKVSKSSSGDKEFVSTILKSGTVTDRVSALTLLIQESPFHHLTALKKNLFSGMAMRKSRREALLALDSMKDLFINNILPDRKLKYFGDQALVGNPSKKNLVLWFFEDSIKKLYFEFIKRLEELSKDSLEHVRNKALIYIHALLVSKPEQEQNLLTLLVDKIGDLDRKIASKVVFLLLQALDTHPNMKMVFVKETEQLIFRPNVPRRTQYSAVTFLNQIPLSKGSIGTACANHLISLYLSLFERIVKESREEEEQVANAKKEDKKKKKPLKKKGKKKLDNQEKEQIEGINAKMMAALLTGVNRAFPFADIDDET